MKKYFLGKLNLEVSAVSLSCIELSYEYGISTEKILTTIMILKVFWRYSY